MEKLTPTLKPDVVAVTLEGMTHEVEATKKVAMMCLTLANAMSQLGMSVNECKEPTQVTLTLKNGVCEFSFASGSVERGGEHGARRAVGQAYPELLH